MRRKQHLKITFVRLVNGEEYPSEVEYIGLSADKAIQRLMNDVRTVGQCEIRIKDILHL